MDIRKDLVDLHHMFHHFGWTDQIFTHISARIPNTDTILMKPFSLFFDEVSIDNLVEINIHDVTNNSSNDINEPGWNIHSAIHLAREDVIFVAHAHTTEIVAVSSTQSGLVSMSQYSDFVRHDIRRHSYEGVVFEEDEKPRIVNSLGSSKCMLMDNHGSIVVAPDAKRLLFRQFMLQRACEVQCIANMRDVKTIGNTRAPDHRTRLNNPPSSELLWNAVKRRIENGN